MPKQMEKPFILDNTYELAIGIAFNKYCMKLAEDGASLLPIIKNTFMLTPIPIAVVVFFVLKEKHPIKVDKANIPIISASIIIIMACPMLKLPKENKAIIL